MNIVKASIRNENGEFLVVRRSPEEKLFPDLWDFPGGRTETGETGEEAIRREIAEELGLDADEIAEMGTYELIEKDAPLDFTVFDVVLSPGEVAVNPDEYSEFKWATMAEILEWEHTPFLDLYFAEFPDIS